MTDLLTRLESLLTPNADGLLPCEKCGGIHVYIEDDRDLRRNYDEKWRTRCRACSHGTWYTISRDEAIKTHNRRPILRALVEAVKQKHTWIVIAMTDPAVPNIGAAVAKAVAEDDAAILAIIDDKVKT